MFRPLLLRRCSRSIFNIRQQHTTASIPWTEPFLQVRSGKLPPIVTGEEAVSVIKSGDRVFLHSAAAYPRHLVQCMSTLAQKPNPVKNVQVFHLHVEGDCPYLKYPESFRSQNFFVGPSQREAVNDGRADYIPIFLSEVALLFRSGRVPLDVAMISVSPPDRHGYCSLGPSVDVTLDAVDSARVVVAQVNNHIPRTHGYGVIHISRLNYLVEHNEPIPHFELPQTSTPELSTISKLVSDLVEDRSTLQVGIGAIPDAVVRNLTDRKDLGVHSEMISDGIMELMLSGVITNLYKAVNPHHVVASFLVGSNKLYDFVDDNPAIELAPSHFVNDPSVIRRNPRTVAINSAVQLDITGQVCADSFGTRIISGFGGQVDFERGAALSENGKPIIALMSRTPKGTPRIVPTLEPGGGVVTTRAHVHWVVTEYGAVNLFGLTLRERALKMIDIAHPDDRAALYDDAVKRYGKSFSILK